MSGPIEIKMCWRVAKHVRDALTELIDESRHYQVGVVISKRQLEGGAHFAVRTVKE